MSFFGPDFDKLGSEDFETRNNELKNIKKIYPLNIIGILYGNKSLDPEIQFQCENIITKNKSATTIMRITKVYDCQAWKMINSDKMTQIIPARTKLSDLEEWRNFVFISKIMKLHDPESEILLYEYKGEALQMIWARRICQKHKIKFSYDNSWPLPKDWKLE
jgi:hypothetical protein